MKLAELERHPVLLVPRFVSVCPLPLLSLPMLNESRNVLLALRMALFVHEGTVLHRSAPSVSVLLNVVNLRVHPQHFFSMPRNLTTLQVA